MSREELLAALVVERFGPPVRVDRARVAPNMAEILAELDAAPVPIRTASLGISCHYAACEFKATTYLDGWALCPTHIRKHRSEAAS